MTEHHVQISSDGAKVELDGRDIANALTSVDVALRLGELPRVMLDLAIIDLGPIDLPLSKVHIPDETAELLISLGWSPPAS